MQIHPEPEETEVLPLSQAGTPRRVTLDTKGGSEEVKVVTVASMPDGMRGAASLPLAPALAPGPSPSTAPTPRRRQSAVGGVLASIRDRRISCQLMRPTNALRPLVVNKTGKRNSVLAADSLDRGRVRQMKISDLPMTEHGDSLRSGQDKDLRDGSYLTEMLTERQRSSVRVALHTHSLARAQHATLTMHACILAGRPPKQPI